MLSLGPIAFGAHPSDWSRQDTWREAACIGLLAADWSQTRQIAADPDLNECNPILGRHPSATRVNHYFIGAAVLHVLAARALPPKPRRIFQGLTIGIEAGCLGRNYRLGVRVRF